MSEATHDTRPVVECWNHASCIQEGCGICCGCGQLLELDRRLDSLATLWRNIRDAALGCAAFRDGWIVSDCFLNTKPNQLHCGAIMYDLLHVPPGREWAWLPGCGWSRPELKS